MRGKEICYRSKRPLSILALFRWVMSRQKEIFPSSVGYNAGCWFTNRVHWSRNPRHWLVLPSNLSGKASRGFTLMGGVGAAATTGGVSGTGGAPAGKCKLWRVLTRSSVSEVSLCNWWWWAANCWACADSSVVSWYIAAGSCGGEVFCNDSLLALGSICSLFIEQVNIHSQYWTQHEQYKGTGRIRIVKQFQGRGRRLSSVVINKQRVRAGSNPRERSISKAEVRKAGG